MWRSDQLGRCDLPGPPQAELGGPPVVGAVGNIVPVLCQLRPRPRPQTDPWFTDDSPGNVMLFPEQIQRTREGPLVAVQGGLVTDSSLRARVSAIVGPGATPAGIAQRLLPLYRSAPKPAGRIPRVTWLLALAHRFEMMIRDDAAQT